ncbi:MAG: PEP-CTERM sorting domain-containing protein [Planctomycetales bacterium]|nr:PEP-CTERM sorting domain-containing protein [Planctomycetales bacterium]
MQRLTHRSWEREQRVRADRPVTNRLVLFGVCACLAVFTSTSASAQAILDVWTGNGDGVDWADSANWDGGLPGFLVTAAITNGDTVSISSDVGTMDGVLISDGHVLQTGGSLVASGGSPATGSLSFPSNTGGSYTITAGTATFGDPAAGNGGRDGWASIGGESDTDGSLPGNGEFNMSGSAAVTFYNRLHVPRSGTGVMNVNGGTLDIQLNGTDQYNDGLAIGDQAGSVGYFNVTAGTVNVGGNARVGNWQGTGTINLSGGTFNVVDTAGGIGQLSVGSEADGIAQGTVNHTGGVLTTTELLIAQDNDSVGDYTINESDGPASLTVTGLTSSRGGAGNFNIQGGTVSLDETVIGVNAGTKSNHTLNISGGNVDIRKLEIAREGPASLSVIGSDATIDIAEDFDLGSTGSALAVFNVTLDNGGLSPINVQNDATLVGTIDIEVPSGVSVSSGSIFDVVDANIGGLGSGLTSLLTLDAGDVGSWDLIVTANKLQIQALVDFNAGLDGDANGDGWVDGLDYLIWAGNYDTIGPPTPGISDGNFNGDNAVDGLDYLIWAGNFGQHASGTAVPEPGTLALAVMAVAGLFVGRRRTRQ